MGSAEGNIFIIELWHLSFVIADYQEDLVSKFKVVYCKASQAAYSSTDKLT